MDLEMYNETTAPKWHNAGSTTQQPDYLYWLNLNLFLKLRTIDSWYRKAR